MPLGCLLSTNGLSPSSLCPSESLALCLPTRPSKSVCSEDTAASGGEDRTLHGGRQLSLMTALGFGAVHLAQLDSPT